MHPTTTISPLDTFRIHFPGTRIIVLEDELRYRFRLIGPAKVAEKLSQEIILQYGIPVTADLEIWEIGGFVREISLAVKLVPEEYKIIR